MADMNPKPWTLFIAEKPEQIKEDSHPVGHGPGCIFDWPVPETPSSPSQGSWVFQSELAKQTWVCIKTAASD